MAVLAGTGWLGAGALGREIGVEGTVAAAAGVVPLTVVSGAIFAIALAERPAFDKSPTDEYGRPAMIFFAVAAPTPGKLSNSFSLAVFKSTFWLEAGVLGCETGGEGLVFSAAEVDPLTVASGAIFAMALAERPAFDKSPTDEYGRPAMIFFAVAAPTPGKPSNSSSLAVFKFTLPFVVAVFLEPDVDAREGFVFLLAWPAKMAEAITVHANIVANKRRNTTVLDNLIRFSFRAKLLGAILVRIARPNSKQGYFVFLPETQRVGIE